MNLKAELYTELARRELTLRAWFITQVERLLSSRQLSFVEEPRDAGTDAG